MPKSYNELYSQYKDSMSSILKDNDFYEDLSFDIGGGKNSLSLFHRYFEKKIDLRWVDAIEACIVPLDTIIRNPRKFIVQEEEIVPIERARKITAESVRHLAQHTNMIARVDGDKVTPSQILNVFREESFEIYENRFIYTLIKNVQRFIDARYNVLFNLSDDENMASMKMESEIKHGNELITYKLEIATQSSGGHESQAGKTASAFQRIDRIKRIINEFAGSAFMRELHGCTPVRPPIMRTNVISKDPNFRACLELWQFVSSYTDVGYEIIAKESNEMVSDQYRDDLNELLGVNYLLLKRNVVPEEELKSRLKSRRLKPKMLKRLAEELVLNYDMDEAEIRKVFVDEMKRVSKKKAAGEQKIKDAIARALQAENDRKAEIAEKIRLEEERRKEIERRKKEREAARIAKQIALEKERKAKEKARLKAKKEKELALAKAKREKEKERQRIAKQKELERIKAEKEKAALLKQKERERVAKEKADKIAKEKAAKLKQKEKERAAREKALQQEKAKIAKQKQLEKERLNKEKEKQLEAEKARRIKEKEKERLAREKALQKEKERAAREKEKLKERERVAREKAKLKEKERAEKAKIKEKERREKERLAAKEKERLARERAKLKEKQAKERAQLLAKEKAAKAKAKAKAKKTGTESDK
ncbi:MAG: DUF2357 domain-containing protein [Clostridia bacterium]|nr:DUF2357 domain-containing protein [Clostridia bacterium]